MTPLLKNPQLPLLVYSGSGDQSDERNPLSSCVTSSFISLTDSTLPLELVNAVSSCKAAEEWPKVERCQSQTKSLACASYKPSKKVECNITADTTHTRLSAAAPVQSFTRPKPNASLTLNFPHIFILVTIR